jgi:hypothetical protein
LQEISLKTAIWYCDEPICEGENFQNIPWIKKQKLIAELGLKADRGFFTVKMLRVLRSVGKNLKGADPDEARAELKWLKEYNIAKKPARQKPKRRKRVSNKSQRRKRLL